MTGLFAVKIVKAFAVGEGVPKWAGFLVDRFTTKVEIFGFVGNHCVIGDLSGGGWVFAQIEQKADQVGPFLIGEGLDDPSGHEGADFLFLLNISIGNFNDIASC